jgi:hypothetical protein
MTDKELEMGDVVSVAGAVGVLFFNEVARGAANQLVSEFVERVVKPRLRGISSPAVSTLISRRISQYVKVVEARTRRIPSVAARDGSMAFDEAYEPLWIRRRDSDDQPVAVDGFPRQVFDDHRCVVITDNAGMGKSTLSKRIVRGVIADHNIIPFLVELRRLSSGSLLDAICADITQEPRGSASWTALLEVFANGGFLFVFDGYDELPDELRKAVAEEIEEIAVGAHPKLTTSAR